MGRAAKGIVFGAFILLAAAAALLWRQPPFLAAPADPRVGARVYQQNCAVCHGSAGEGRDPAPPLNATGHADHHPDWELSMFIAEGKIGFGQMPGWKGLLSDREIRSVIAFVKTLWTEDQRRSHQRLNEIRPAPPR